MAPRYGGHEDLERERQLLRQLESGLDSLTAKEQVARREAGATEGALERQTSRRERLTQIQREQRAVQERAAATQNVEARALDQTTEAIARNAAARERAAVAAVNQERAFKGARDPLYGRATALGAEGLPPSQYQMRRELGIGSARAQRLQEAMQAGYVPARPQAHDQPLTAARAAVQADIDKAAATKAYNAAVRRGDLAAAEAAQAARQEAQARKQAATAALESSRSEQAAGGAAKAEAAQREREMTQRAAGGSGALVPRTPAAGAVGGRMFGESGPFYGAFPPPNRGLPRAIIEPGATGGAARDTAATRQQAAAHQTLLQSLSAEERAIHLDTYERAAQLRARMATVEQGLGRATAFSAVELGTANQQMRRHGTLTSEFIQAAMRGETTLREVGQQALVTAGKFGSWTLAASAIYGAVAAVHQVGQGAIDASTGVNQLQRVIQHGVNADELKQQFGDLAGEFNVPMNVATDAVYRMGQVFHNQADAVEAARAALYSYKTGEVDVATSSQNLIAIVNGFGLSANDLTKVYDQINQAQNTFGVRIGDTESGLAKAAGTFRNAGGDLNYLLALFVAIQKATGRSGQEVGTGIARGVNQIRQASNQAKLRQQGVDVDPDNFQKTLQSAMEAAKKPGADLQQIASGLLGNQYARLIAPVLRDQTLLNRAIKDTSPEASKNSAQRELATVLKGVDEQITSVGVNLQRLGSALARAGAGDFAYLMLRGLNLVLGTAVKIVEVFDKLPVPLRHALTIMAQMAIAVSVLRRFGGLPGIANRTGLSFLSSPDNILRNRVVRGGRDFIEAADKDVERGTQTAYRARTNVEVEAARAAESQARLNASRAEAGSAERLRLEEENARLNARALAAQEAANAAEDDLAVAKRRQQLAIEEQARISKLSAAELRAEVAAGRLAYPASFNVPERQGALTGDPARQVVAPAAANGRGPTAFRPGTLEDDILFATTGQRAVQREAAQIETLTREKGRFERSLARGGVVSGRLGRAADSVAGRLPNASRVVAGAGRGLAQVASGLGRMVSALGPLDIAIIGFFALSEINSIAEKITADQDKLFADLERFPATAEGVRARAEAAKRGVRTDTGGPGHIAANARQGAQYLGDVIHFRGFSGDYETPWDRAQRLKDEAKMTQDELDRNKRLQDEARAKGRPIPLQTLDQVKGRIDRDSKLRSQGIISMAEFDRRMHDHAVEIQTSLGGTNQSLTAARQALAAARRKQATDLFHRYQGAGVQEITDRMSLLGAQVETGDASQATLREYGYAYRRLTEQYAGASDPKTLLQFFQAREAYFKSLETGAQTELQNSLASAQTEGQRQAAFRQAASRYRAIPQADKTQLANDARRTTETANRLRAEQLGLRGARKAGLTGDTADSLLGGLSNLPGLPGQLAAEGKRGLEKLESSAKADRAQLAKLRKAVGEDSKRYKEALRRQHRDEQALAEQALADRDQGRDISLALAQSRTTDPVRQANLAVQSAQKSLADARAHGNDRDRKQAQTKLNQAERSQDQALIARAQALSQLREAQVALATGSDPGAMARAAVTSAQSALAALRAHHGSPEEIIQARAAVLQSEAALAQQTHDDALALSQLRFQLAAARAGGSPEAEARAAKQIATNELAHARNAKERLQALLDLANANNQAEQVAADAEQARYELLASLTADPVKQAGYRVQADRAALRHAHGKTARDRARAQLNNDRRAERDARLQGREDDIDFNLEMERISRTTAISQFQQLLKMHNLTKQQRRDILRRIHALQKEGEDEASGFGLQVGQGVKLPTVYDVRRAISGARKAADQGTTIHAKTTATVNVEINDPDAVPAFVAALDDALNTGAKANLRAAGMSL